MNTDRTHGPTRHMLEIDDLGPTGVAQVLALAGRDPATLARTLEGRGVALVFEKPSARTRNSSEMATVALGGHPVYIQGAEVGIDVRETAADVVHDPGTHHPVEAGQGAGHVGGRLAHVDAHFCALYVHRVPAEGHGGHL